MSTILLHATKSAGFGGFWRVIAFCALLAGGFAHAEVPVPPLKARVTDLTGTLDAQQQASLEQTLRAFEAKKGSQIAVLMVPTSQPETIEQYSIRVAEQWKLGRKGVDDGVLLLIAKDDRKLRIEVGRGLEGALPDVIAKRIIREIITPRFKERDFYGGITAGVASIIKVIEGEPLPPPKAEQRSTGAGPDVESWLVLAFGVIVVGGAILRAIFGRFLGASIVGGAAGVIAWLLVGPLLVAIIVGLVALVFNLFGGAGGWGGRSSGWTGGGWSSGGWSGGSGGGFSGGGGDFGGGGASGSW